MPTYEYRCAKCGKEFEHVEHVAEHEAKAKPRCPECGNKEVVSVMAPFVAKTAKKS